MHFQTNNNASPSNFVVDHFQVRKSVSWRCMDVFTWHGGFKSHWAATRKAFAKLLLQLFGLGARRCSILRAQVH